MPTNDRKVNVYPKRLLGLTAIKDEFLDYLQGAVDDIASGFFAGSSGTLDQDKVDLNNGHGGSTFDIDTTDAQRVLAGNHTIDLTKITGAGITHTIPFENFATSYYAGVFFAEVEVGIEINARTGDPEYSSLKQTFGNVDNPASVVDGTTYIRLNLNSITESGASHAGRDVRVWLVDPVSPNEAIAFFDGTVAYSAPNNYVDIPYSGANGPLGQDTSAAPPSTTSTDYKVFIEGVSWRRFTDLRTVPTCAFLGVITGGSPPTFNITDQVVLQIVSLDRAYDGIPGPGTGRKIYADAGAVEIASMGVGDSNPSGDKHFASLRIDRSDNNFYFQLALEVLMGNQGALPVACLQELGSVKNEAVDVIGDAVTFTAGGVNLLNKDLDPNLHLLWIKTGTAAGLYLIATVGAASMTCTDLQTGVSPAWGAEVGLAASVIIPRMTFSNTRPGGPDPSALAHWKGLMLVGSDGGNNPSPMLRAIPQGGYGALLQIKNNRRNVVTGLMDPRDLMWLDFDMPAAGSPGGRLQLGQYIGTVGPESGVHTKIGLDFRPAVQGTGAADKYAFNVKPQLDGGGTRKPSTRQIGLHNDLSSPVEIMRWEPKGRMADSHRFVEKWDYLSTGFLPASERWYKHDWGNGGTLYFNDPVNIGGMDGHGDILHIATAGVAIGDGVDVQGPAIWIPRQRAAATVDRRLNFYARARAIATDQEVWYGLGIFNSLLTQNVIAFRIYNNAAAPSAGWEMHSRSGGGSDNTSPAGAVDLTGTTNNDLGWADFYFTVDTAINMVSFWMTGMASPSAQNIRAAGMDLSWDDVRVQPFAVCYQFNGTNARRLEVDHIEVWDELILSGPME